MAEDIQEDGSEEKKNQKTSAQDDDDFGLPDLEFEELEELDLDFDDEKEASDEVDIEEIIVAKEENEGITNDSDLVIDQGVDPDQDASRVLEGEEDDDSGIDFSSSDEGTIDLGEESTDSMFTADSDEASDSEGDSLFGDSEDFSGGSIFESDEIALKEEEQPEFQSADEAELPAGYKPYSDEGEKGGFTKIIIFGTIGITLIGLVFLFAPRQEGDDSETHKETKTVVKTDKPKDTKKVTEKAASPKSDDKKKTADSSKKVTKKSTPAPAPKVVKKVSQPASAAPAGEIINVQEKTGRAYIIIGSFIDQDLANDFAKELAGKGKGAKVIFPYGKSKRYRVSVADFDSYSDAAAQINSYKSTYGEDAWALKY
jgi:cell division protein FtsN